MKWFFLFLGFQIQLASAVYIQDYPYPYPDNPYLASVTFSLLRPNQEPEKLILQGLPGREAVPLVPGEGRIELTYFTQNRAAPLVFVLTGTGGSSADGAAQFLAEELFNLGFSAIVLPSPFSWQFVASQSSSGVPGYAPADAEDLYRLMKNSLTQFQLRTGAQVTSTSMIGYSLGAVNVAFLEQLDQQRHEFNFQRAVMINPPLNISAATNKIDQLAAIGNDWSIDDKNSIWGKVLSIGEALLRSASTNSNPILSLRDKLFPNEPDKLQFLIGDNFRKVLVDVILTSQQLHDTGILGASSTPLDRNRREGKAKRMSFADYNQKLANPFWTAKLQVSTDQLFAESDIRQFKNQFAKNGAVYLMHNQDDFLTNAADLQDFAAALGNRAFIYPSGGHIGNLWHPLNQAHLKSIFSGVR